jgi:adenosine deaminase
VEAVRIASIDAERRLLPTCEEDRFMTEIETFIAAMPKCELHVHLEGTLEPEMKFRLADRNRLTLPYASIEELKASYTFHDLPSFLAIYYDGMRVLLTEPDFYDLTLAYLSKARSQGVVYAEMFFDPQAHTSRGVGFDTVIRGIRRAQLDAETRLGIRSQLIMCFLRDWSAEYAMATLLESLPYKEWIIGVGLDSDEKNNPPVKFRAVFARARQEGYFLTMHCDVDQENSTKHIGQCLDEIGVDRIDHGVNSLDDASLPPVLRERGIGLTVCPISNAYVTGDTKSSHIKRMLDLGMRVTVNSDDPAYFASYISENLMRVQQESDLSRQETMQLVRNAFEVAWLPRRTKDLFIAQLDSYSS